MPRGQDKLLVFTPPSRQDAAGLRRARNPDPRDGFQFNRTKSYELCDRRLFDDDGRQPTPLIGPGGERHGMSGISKSLNPRRNSDVFNESRAALCLLLASKRN